MAGGGLFSFFFGGGWGPSQRLHEPTKAWRRTPFKDISVHGGPCLVTSRLDADCGSAVCRGPESLSEYLVSGHSVPSATDINVMKQGQGLTMCSNAK